MTTLNLILGATVVLYFVGRNPNGWVIVWPGTVVHEIMHAVVGLVLLASPANFSVVPKPQVDGEERVIGSVDFYSMNWFNAFPIAIAPFFAIPLVLMNLHYLHLPKHVSFVTMDWKIGAMVFLVASVLSQAIPSKPDFVVIAKRPFGIVFWGSVIGFAVYHYYHMLPAISKAVLHFIKVL